MIEVTFGSPLLTNETPTVKASDHLWRIMATKIETNCWIVKVEPNARPSKKEWSPRAVRTK